MNNIEESGLYARLTPENQGIVNACADFVNEIWNRIILIQHFTDHSLSHSLRIIKIMEQLPHVIENDFLSQDEKFILILGGLLHDIGMQCDIRKHERVREIAINKYGASFDCERFDASRDLTLAQQNEMRKNHHLLTCAWIYSAFNEEKKSDLWKAIYNVPRDLMPCLIDVCSYHSKRCIRECAVLSKNVPNFRIQLVAAILRLSDELEIGNDKISEIDINNFVVPKEIVFFGTCMGTLVLILRIRSILYFQ